MQLLAKSSRFVIAAEDARGDNVAELTLSACADRASVVRTHASTSAALTSFGVRGKGSPLPTAASPITELSNGAGRPSCGGRRTAGSHIQDMTRAGRIIAAAAVGCAAGEEGDPARPLRAFTSSRPEPQPPFFGSRCAASPSTCSSPNHEDFTMHHLVRPNNSVEARPNGRPRSTALVFSAPRGLPSVPPHLERSASQQASFALVAHGLHFTHARGEDR